MTDARANNFQRGRLEPPWQNSAEDMIASAADDIEDEEVIHVSAYPNGQCSRTAPVSRKYFRSERNKDLIQPRPSDQMSSHHHSHRLNLSAPESLGGGPAVGSATSAFVRTNSGASRGHKSGPVIRNLQAGQMAVSAAPTSSMDYSPISILASGTPPLAPGPHSAPATFSWGKQSPIPHHHLTSLQRLTASPLLGPHSPTPPPPSSVASLTSSTPGNSGGRGMMSANSGSVGGSTSSSPSPFILSPGHESAFISPKLTSSPVQPAGQQLPALLPNGMAAEHATPATAAQQLPPPPLIPSTQQLHAAAVSLYAAASLRASTQQSAVAMAENGGKVKPSAASRTATSADQLLSISLSSSGSNNQQHKSDIPVGIAVARQRQQQQQQQQTDLATASTAASIQAAQAAAAAAALLQHHSKDHPLWRHHPPAPPPAAPTTHQSILNHLNASGAAMAALYAQQLAAAAGGGGAAAAAAGSALSEYLSANSSAAAAANFLAAVSASKAVTITSAITSTTSVSTSSLAQGGPYLGNPGIAGSAGASPFWPPYGYAPSPLVYPTPLQHYQQFQSQILLLQQTAAAGLTSLPTHPQVGNYVGAGFNYSDPHSQLLLEPYSLFSSGLSLNGGGSYSSRGHLPGRSAEVTESKKEPETASSPEVIFERSTIHKKSSKDDSGLETSNGSMAGTSSASVHHETSSSISIAEDTTESISIVSSAESPSLEVSRKQDDRLIASRSDILAADDLEDSARVDNSTSSIEAVVEDTPEVTEVVKRKKKVNSSFAEEDNISVGTEGEPTPMGQPAVADSEQVNLSPSKSQVNHSVIETSSGSDITSSKLLKDPSTPKILLKGDNQNGSSTQQPPAIVLESPQDDDDIQDNKDDLKSKEDTIDGLLLLSEGIERMDQERLGDYSEEQLVRPGSRLTRHLSMDSSSYKRANLGLLCDVATQKMKEFENSLTAGPRTVRSKSAEVKRSDLNHNYRNSLKDDTYRQVQQEKIREFIKRRSSKSSDSSATSSSYTSHTGLAGGSSSSPCKSSDLDDMDAWEISMRLDMADIQRKYRQTYQELYKLDCRKVNQRVKPKKSHKTKKHRHHKRSISLSPQKLPSSSSHKLAAPKAQTADPVVKEEEKSHAVGRLVVAEAGADTIVPAAQNGIGNSFDVDPKNCDREREADESRITEEPEARVDSNKLNFNETFAKFKKSYLLSYKAQQQQQAGGATTAVTYSQASSPAASLISRQTKCDTTSSTPPTGTGFIRPRPFENLMRLNSVPSSSSSPPVTVKPEPPEWPSSSSSNSLGVTSSHLHQHSLGEIVSGVKQEPQPTPAEGACSPDSSYLMMTTPADDGREEMRRNSSSDGKPEVLKIFNRSKRQSNFSTSSSNNDAEDALTYDDDLVGPDHKRRKVDEGDHVITAAADSHHRAADNMLAADDYLVGKSSRRKHEKKKKNHHHHRHHRHSESDEHSADGGWEQRHKRKKDRRGRSEEEALDYRHQIKQEARSLSESGGEEEDGAFKRKKAKKHSKDRKEKDKRKKKRKEKSKRVRVTGIPENDYYVMEIIDRTPTPSSGGSHANIKQEPTEERVDARKCILTERNLEDGQRILFRSGGHFHPGRITEISAPDIYGIVVDKERGNKPHIYPREEVLSRSILEVSPASMADLTPGVRVCAYWSNKYHYLHPGTIVENTQGLNLQPGFVIIELDDGDSRDFQMDTIRLLPPDYPIVVSDPDPMTGLATAQRVRKSISTDSNRLSVDSKQQHKHRHHNNNNNNNSAMRIKEEPMEDDFSAVNNNDDDIRQHHSSSRKSSSSRHKKSGRKRHRASSKEWCHSSGTGAGSTINGGLKIRIKSSGDSNVSSSSHRGVASSSSRSYNIKQEPLDHDMEMEGLRRLQEEVEVDPRHRHREEDGEDSAFESNGGKGEEEEDYGFVEDDNLNQLRKTFPGEDKSKIRTFLPPEHVCWCWDDVGIKAKNKSRKVFHKKIKRESQTNDGSETEELRVGESAVFLSTSKPDRPYVGRIESMWETWSGNMKVRVRWFYHAEETGGANERGKRGEDLKQPGALFESTHFDDNDIQTISHKCEVLPYPDFDERLKSNPMLANGIYEYNDLYYLGGSYDPVVGTINFRPDVFPAFSKKTTVATASPPAPSSGQIGQY